MANSALRRKVRKTFSERVIPNNDNVIAMDVFRNAPARIGFDTPSLAESAEYQLVRYSNDYWLMVTMFRNHWISRRIIEKPAQDMAKAFPRLTCELKPDQIADFDRLIAKTQTRARLQTAMTWARLFGGAGALMVIDGQENMLDEPLDLDSINPGTYKGLIVFDRWSGITPGTETVDDINYITDFGLPKYYDVHSENSEMFRVHHSRILRFCGPQVPNPEFYAQLKWGISELEPVYEELRKRDNMSWSILNLLFRAQLIGQKNPELAQLLSGAASSKDALLHFQQRMQAQNELLSNQSMMIVGEDGDVFTHSYSFAGVSEIYSQFQMDIAGAARIPVSILFGRTISGIGQSNDADIRIYEQDIAQKQNEELRPQLDKLLPVMCMSEFGEVPDDLDYIFPSIRVLTEEQKADMAVKSGEAILAPFEAGVTSQKNVLQELKQVSDLTGIHSNITDEQIDAADDQPNVPLEVEVAESRAGSETFEEDDEADEPEEKKPKKKAKAKDSQPDLLDWISNKINLWRMER